MYFFWLFCCIFLICYYFFSSISILKNFQSPLIKQEGIEKYNFPVSVIVCLHNEENNINNLLEALLSQNYFKFEIILVDDRSSDKTPLLLSKYSHHPNIQIVTINESPLNWSPKKWAINQGILNAKYEYLVFTDADCLPKPNWLQNLTPSFEKANVIIGYSPFEKTNSFVNLWARLENFFTAFQYISAAIFKIPYMAVGRNLAYTKELYFKHGGIENHKNLLSGDDDLLINQVQNKSRIEVNLNPETFVTSYAPTSWNKYFRQKTRHVSASTSYSFQSQIFLALVHFCNLFFWALLPFIIQIPNSSFFVIIFLIIKYLGLSISMIKLKQKDLIWALPILEIGIFIYDLVVVPMGWFKKPKW